MNLVPRSLLNLYLSTQQSAGSNQELLLVVTRVSAGFQDRGAHLDPEKGLPQCTQVNLSEPAAYNRCVRARSHPGVSVLQLPDAGRLLCGHVLVHRNEGEVQGLPKSKQLEQAAKSILPATTVRHFASKHCVEGTPGSRLESI